MRILESSSPGFARSLRAFCRKAESSDALRLSVGKILEDIRSGGDPAVRTCLETFDRVRLRTRDLTIDASEMRAAWSRLPSGDRRAMKDALRNIRIFNRMGLPADWMGRNGHGARVGECFHPLDRVGIYIPRGLVSTVLMTCGLARLAGVPEIAVFTPSDPEGAVGEYNAKFMSGQIVLRGGSSLTPPGHARSTYRNFFPPSARWPMTRLRLARGVRS